MRVLRNTLNGYICLFKEETVSSFFSHVFAERHSEIRPSSAEDEPKLFSLTLPQTWEEPVACVVYLPRAVGISRRRKERRGAAHERCLIAPYGVLSVSKRRGSTAICINNTLESFSKVGREECWG
ncbi:hypothetical protein OPV22_001784 [Ensete ventricosum]|uniref:Uncharacterized protein n=1 Tax=Ensete ventricosum TaxID=4639 RepID=A0AAV8RRW6_ENSVE|nr:hypothetical protein OPV22_001784 [Ensete ventricosum]